MLDVGEQRAVHRGADREGERVLAGDLDRLGAPLERLPLLAALVALAVDGLEVEVGDVGPEVREAPGDLLVVADDHAGEAGEGEARDVERAVVVDLGAVQAHLVPDARQRRREVRVVGQDRLAGRGVVSVDDPGVAADRRRRVPTMAGIASSASPASASSCVERPRSRQRRAGAGGPRRRRLAASKPPVDDGAAARRSARAARRGTAGRARRPAPRSRAGRGHRPVDLVLHVAAQVPRHRLEPGHRVRRGPVLDPVVEAADARAACTPARSRPASGRAR